LYIFSRFVSRSRRWVDLPYFIIGGIATITGILGPHRYSILVGASLILLGLISLAFGKKATSQTGNSRVRRTFPIGQYTLDPGVEGMNGLIEFSAAEYMGRRRKFEGEKNYNAPPVSFLGRQWSLQLGTVYGKTYKIARYLQLIEKQEAIPSLWARGGRPGLACGEFRDSDNPANFRRATKAPTHLVGFRG
jgi:hypothetical protein